jgi:excisionase family DNA binding protein
VKPSETFETLGTPCTDPPYTDHLPSDVPDWLTAEQVAEQLGVGVRTVYRLIEAHRLRAADFAPRGRPIYRIRQEWLDAFIERASGERSDSDS